MIMRGKKEREKRKGRGERIRKISRINHASCKRGVVCEGNFLFRRKMIRVNQMKVRQRVCLIYTCVT